MSVNWLIVGIAGATCSGKTTLAERLTKNLRNSTMINQDKYFLPKNDPRHTWINELNFQNWDIITSLDMNKMIRDIKDIIDKPTKINNEDDISNVEQRVLILDGFLLFNCVEIVKICDLMYYLDMSEDECVKRRKLRIYDPPDVQYYFERVVWPEYVKAREEILRDENLRERITFIDGTRSKEETFLRVYDDIKKFLSM